MVHSRVSLVLALVALTGSAARADIWHAGDLTTYTQASWGGDPGVDGGATVLDGSFDNVYAPTGGVIVGSASGFTMVFTGAASALAYLPAIGPFAALNGNVQNPISTASGGLGGEALGLEFNVDFSDAGLLPGSSGLRFGDLLLENFSAEPVFNGLTVRQFLGDVNTLLGGRTTLFTISDLGTTVQDLNASFSDGIPLAFAQEHLVAPTSASTVPEPASWLLMIPAVFGLVWTRRLRRR